MFIQSPITILGLVLGLGSLANAAGIYSYTLKDASGVEVPVETFALPSTSRPGSLGQSINSKRQTIEYSSNWCGAVQLDPPAGQGIFTSVSGTWTVPVVTPPTDGTGTNALYYVYQWVGIDGYYWSNTCDALIQAGTGFILQNDAVVDLFVWTEYYPDGVVGVNMAVREGDVFTVTVTTTSTTTGIITIVNHTTGQTLTANINGTGVGTLCGLTAEWIVENPDSGSEPFPDFSNTDFTSCSSVTSTGAAGGLSGAALLYGEASGSTPRCEATIISSSVVDVFYVNP